MKCKFKKYGSVTVPDQGTNNINACLLQVAGVEVGDRRLLLEMWDTIAE